MKTKIKKRKIIKSVVEDDTLPTALSAGVASLDKIRLLIYGPPKIGKSTLAAGWPHAVFLTTEKRHETLKIYPKEIKSWEQFKAVVATIIKGKHNFKTIVIDTVDILFKLCNDAMCEQLNIDHVSDEGWGKGYDIIGNEFEREINKLFLTDYGVILISHTKTQDLTNTSGKYTKIIPTLPNLGRRVILPKVSVIGYMRLKSVKVDKNNYEERRVISFEPSEFVEAGDGDGYLPNELPVYKDSKKTYALFKKYYDKKGGAV